MLHSVFIHHIQLGIFLLNQFLLDLFSWRASIKELTKNEGRTRGDVQNDLEPVSDGRSCIL